MNIEFTPIDKHKSKIFKRKYHWYKNKNIKEDIKGPAIIINLNNTATTVQALRFECGIVPKDFTYNGMNVPRIFWSIAGHPFQGRGIRAACIHDYLYTYGYKFNISRAKSDWIFLKELLKANIAYYENKKNKTVRASIAGIRCFLKYLLVRLFGFYHYNKIRSNNEQHCI